VNGDGIISRNSIHAHGTARLKNDPGLVDLTAKAYRGIKSQMKFPLEENKILKYPHYVKLINEGSVAEIIMTKYIDTLATAMNPREIHRDTDVEKDSHQHPHPCCFDISLISQADYPNDFIELVNCVQRHVCRLNGYCKKKGTTGFNYTKKLLAEPACRFGYPFPVKKTILSIS